jgi:hypothetical protein
MATITQNNIAAKIEAAKEMRYKMRDIDTIHFQFLPNTNRTKIDFCGLSFTVCAANLSETLGLLLPPVFGVIAETDIKGIKTAAVLQNGNEAFTMVRHLLEMSYYDQIGHICLDSARIEAIGLLQFLLPFAAQGLTYGEIERQIFEYCDDDLDLLERFEAIKENCILGGTL